MPQTLSTIALGHDELLAQIEKFMLTSGIRKFCRERCQGACCCSPKTDYQCDPQQQGCQNEPHLMCSAWLCDALRSIIAYVAKQQKHNRANRFIEFYCADFRSDLFYSFSNLMRHYGGIYSNRRCFSQPTPPAVRERFSLPPCPALTDEEIMNDITAVMAIIDQAVTDSPKRSGLIGLIREQQRLGDLLLSYYFP